MWQTVIVIGISILAAGYILKCLIRSFKSAAKGKGGCNGCSGCNLKNSDPKQSKCKESEQE